MVQNNCIKYFPPTMQNLINISRKKISCVSPHFFNDPIDCYALRNKHILDSITNNTIKDKLRKIRICSLVEKTGESNQDDQLALNERLMWTHYADSYKGFSMEFYLDYSNDIPGINDNDFTRLIRVNYVDGIIDQVEDAMNNIEQDDFKDFILGIIFLKDDAFKYEKEIRLIRLAENNDTNFVYIEMPEPKNIVFGLYADSEFKESLKNIIHLSFPSGSTKFYQINNKLRRVKDE